MPDRTESHLAHRQAWLLGSVFWATTLVAAGFAFVSLYWPFISGVEYH